LSGLTFTNGRLLRERRESRRTEVQMKEQVKGKEKLRKSTKIIQII